MHSDRPKNRRTPGSQLFRRKSKESEAYEYRSLPGPTSFRLIDVYGILEDSSIKCDLHTVDLEHHPQYEALSYTWGNPFAENDSESNSAYYAEYLNLKGKSKDRPKNQWRSSWTLGGSRSTPRLRQPSVTIDGYLIPVTQNLYDALQMILLPRGVNGQDGRFNKTALHWAAEEGRLETVRNLLAQGADLHLRDFFGETPMHYAAENGHLDVVKTLVDAGADTSLVDKSGRTPLGCATQSSHSAVISFLESREDTPETKTAFKQTPQHLMVWIDALCIDQNNSSERTTQVAMMHHIFSQALRVVVWLGPEDATSEEAVKDMHKLCAGADWSPARQEKMKNRLEKLSHKRAFGLRRLFQRSWFERVWITQELVMAQHVLMYCGPHEILWEDLWRFHTFSPSIAMGYFMSQGWTRLGSLPQYAPSIRLLRALRHDHRHKDGDSRHQTLSDLLRLTMTMSSTKPEDKVFSVLGISRSSPAVTEAFPAPDYSMEVDEIYKRAAAVILKESEDIDFLLGAPRSSTVSPLHDKLPSWVPDFSLNTSTAAEPLPRERFAAAPSFSICPSLSPDRTSLRIQARQVGSITHVHPILEKHTEYYLPIILLEWIRFGLLLPFPPNNTTNTQPNSPHRHRRSTTLLETISAGSITSAMDSFAILWLSCAASIIDEDDLYDLPRWISRPPQTSELKRLALSTTTSTANNKAPGVDPLLTLSYNLHTNLRLSLASPLQRSKYKKGLADRWGAADLDLLSSLARVWHALEALAGPLPVQKWVEFQSKVNVCAGRRLVVTDEGRAGLAPATARVGDGVWLVRGFGAPVVLEEVGGGRFRFKGEAYVQGLMKGEGYDREGNLEGQFKGIELV